MFMSQFQCTNSVSQPEGITNDVRVLQQLLQEKHEQLILAREVVHQLTQQTRSQSLAIHSLQSQLVDSEGKVDALESEVRGCQHRINHLTEHQHQSTQENATLTDRVRDAKEQIADQRLTIEMLRRSVHQQETHSQALMHLQAASTQKHKAELAELQRKCASLTEEKRRIKEERLMMNRRHKQLESSMAQSSADNVALKERVEALNQRLEDCGEEIERQNQENATLRRANEELLDRVSRMDSDEEQDPEMKDLLDRCIQVDLSALSLGDSDDGEDEEDRDGNEHEHRMPSIKVSRQRAPEMDIRKMKPMSPGCGTAEYDCLEEEISFIQQYEDHEEYLNLGVEEDDHALHSESTKNGQDADQNKADLLAKLVKEGIEREEEMRKLKGSVTKKRSIWDIFASLI